MPKYKVGTTTTYFDYTEIEANDIKEANQIAVKLISQQYDGLIDNKSYLVESDTTIVVDKQPIFIRMNGKKVIKIENCPFGYELVFTSQQ